MALEVFQLSSIFPEAEQTLQSHHSYDNLKLIAPLTPLEHYGVLDVVFSMLGIK
jgi:hypothetical protein